MQFYSKTILNFLSDQKYALQKILSNEVGVHVNRNRFEWDRYTYPINLVMFEHPRQLGRYDATLYQIGLNKIVMYASNQTAIHNILRHELAHYLCHILYGDSVGTSHGDSFQHVCDTYHWGKDVSSASLKISNNDTLHSVHRPSDQLIQKIKKLMALSQSDNAYESEAATAKANQLLLKNNLSAPSEQSDDEEICSEKVLSAKRKTGKLRAICRILTTFLVEPIYNSGKGIFYIEVIGDRTNVILADYVAQYLDLELEKKWHAAQKYNPHLKGISHKNNFMSGIARGYMEKIKAAQREIIDDHGLILLSNQLKNKIRLVYPRLSSVYSRSQYHAESDRVGREMGKNLYIRPGIRNDTGNVIFQLN